jgi:carboxyl-terminal processing protease
VAIVPSSLLDKLAPGDTAAFYFSGHGVEIEGQNFLLPRDLPDVGYGRREQLRRESLSVSEFLLDLKKRRPQVSLVILDACRTDPFISPELRSVADKGGLASITDPPEGTFIMYSAGAGETALDRLPANDPDPTNSVYTRHLLPLLKTADLTLPELARRVRQNVHDLASRVPHIQRPAYYDGLIGHYCVAGCAVSTPEPKRRVPIASALQGARGAVQRPKLATLMGNDLRPSLDLFGEVMDKARAEHVDQPSDRALMTSAIEEVLRKFGNEKLQGVADRGFAQSKPQSSIDAAAYPLLDVFGDVLEGVLQDHAVSGPAIVRTAIDGMLAGLDTQSRFFDADENRRMRATTFGTFGGVGIEIRKENDKVKVIRVLDGSPAERAGLFVNDLISHIGGQPVDDRTLEQVVDALRGPVNTRITVTLVHDGHPKPIDVTVVRDTIRVNSISYRLEADGAVGYLKMTRFNNQTHQNLLEAVQNLQKPGGEQIKGYVLDLRANSGGPLEQAIALADAFLDRGTIAIIKGRSLQEKERYEAKPGDIINGKKLALIIDEFTATGPEIVAGALQDNKRATIVGVRSNGNASVQTIFSIQNRSAVKLTTARFYTPRGLSIQGRGIQPDLKVENASKKDVDAQLKKAIELITAN